MSRAFTDKEIHDWLLDFSEALGDMVPAVDIAAVKDLGDDTIEGLESEMIQISVAKRVAHELVAFVLPRAKQLQKEIELLRAAWISACLDFHQSQLEALTESDEETEEAAE
jgi:hypothetical protein